MSIDEKIFKFPKNFCWETNGQIAELIKQAEEQLPHLEENSIGYYYYWMLQELKKSTKPVASVDMASMDAAYALGKLEAETAHQPVDRASDDKITDDAGLRGGIDYWLRQFHASCELGIMSPVRFHEIETGILMLFHKWFPKREVEQPVDSRAAFDKWYDREFETLYLPYKERCWQAWQARGALKRESYVADALRPFAEAHRKWSGGDAAHHFSHSVTPADFLRAAEALSKIEGGN